MSDRVMMVASMLDEIERLRKVLAVHHTDTCAVLRSSAPCDCGRGVFALEDLLTMLQRLDAELTLALRALTSS